MHYASYIYYTTFIAAVQQFRKNEHTAIEKHREKYNNKPSEAICRRLMSMKCRKPERS